MHLYLIKVRYHLRQHLLDILQEAVLPLVQPVNQTLRPAIHQGLAAAGNRLIGLGLIVQEHQRVPVDQRGGKPDDHRDGNPEAGILFHAGEIQGDHRHLLQPGLFQRLPEQEDVIGRPASAAGLGDHQRHPVQIIPPALEGVDHLANGEDGGIAGVVVNVFQPGLGDFRACAGEQLRMVAEVIQDAAQNIEMNGGHHGKQDGIFPLHLSGKEQTSRFIIDAFSHWPPPLEGYLFPRLPPRRTGFSAGFSQPPGWRSRQS